MEDGLATCGDDGDYLTMAPALGNDTGQGTGSVEEVLAAACGHRERGAAELLADWGWAPVEIEANDFKPNIRGQPQV